MVREKMMKQAKVLHTISKVLYRIFGAAVIVLAIFALLVLFVKDEGFVTNASRLEFGELELELAENVLPAPENLRSRIAIGLGVSAMISAFLAWFCYVVTGIFAPIKEGRPFEGVVSRGFRSLGIMTLIGGLLIQLVQGLAYNWLIKSYALLDLFKDGMVKAVHVNMSIDMGVVIIALVLFLMSYVFHYGEELQRESDETL